MMISAQIILFCRDKIFPVRVFRLWKRFKAKNAKGRRRKGTIGGTTRLSKDFSRLMLKHRARKNSDAKAC